MYNNSFTGLLQTQRVPSCWGSQILRQPAYECGKVVSHTLRPPLHHRKYSWDSFLLQAESTIWPLCGRKNHVKEKFQWRNRESNPRSRAMPQPTAPSRAAIWKHLVFIMKAIRRSQWPRGLRPLACWDRGFESHPGHGCLSVVSVVCCQVEVSATDWSFVQRSLTEFYIWVSVHHKSIINNKPTRCNSGSIVFIKNYKYALHVPDALYVHLQEHYKL